MRTVADLVLRLFLLTVLALVVIASQGWAHDHRRLDLDQWYRSLESRKGPCCGGPDEDATALGDMQWRTKGDGYEVHVEGQWIDAPPETVVRVPNLAGSARVWLYHSGGEPIVRCFLPGTLS